MAEVRANLHIWSIYFLESLKNKKIYSGFTEKKPQNRLKEHNAGLNKWTKENGPFEILYYEEYICKEDAMRREKFYKTGIGRMIRNKIIEVMRNFKNK